MKRKIKRKYNRKTPIDLERKQKQDFWNKSYYQKNKENILQFRKEYYKKNTMQIKQHQKEYYKKKKKILSDELSDKLATNLRIRLCKALHRNQKRGSAVKDLGCSIIELKQYLESKFQPRMNWNNWGKDGWHIDHIKPLSFFDLSNRNQLLEAVHYTNLQPLWASDNMSKGNKYEKE
jgi:hypothetical protein